MTIRDRVLDGDDNPEVADSVAPQVQRARQRLAHGARVVHLGEFLAQELRDAACELAVELRECLCGCLRDLNTQAKVALYFTESEDALLAAADPLYDLRRQVVVLSVF